MADTDWARLGLEAGASAVSAACGLFVGIWKWGRKSARHEQKVKDDYDAKIRGLREEMRTAMSAQAQKSEENNDLLVSQFKESFDGIRRQFDKHQLDTEKDFLRKEDFRDFREEYREDARELKAMIAEIARKQ